MITGNAKGITIDQNGNLMVETEYTLTNGSKSVGHTRYNAQNFSKAKVLEDIKSQCENIMRKTWNLKQNQELVKTVVDDISHTTTSVELVTKPEIKDMVTGVVTQEKESIIIDDSDPIKG